MEFTAIMQALHYMDISLIDVLILVINACMLLYHGQYKKLLNLAAQQAIHVAGEVLTDDEKRDKLVNYVQSKVPVWAKPFFDERLIDEIVEHAYKIKAKPVIKKIKAQEQASAAQQEPLLQQNAMEYLKEFLQAGIEQGLKNAGAFPAYVPDVSAVAAQAVEDLNPVDDESDHIKIQF